MTDYAQFAHINHAGLKATNNRRGRDKKWTAKKILAEAARVPGNIAHVLNPQKPRWIIGSKEAVQQRQAAWREQAREASGKAKLRATSPSLACAVFSWPRGWEPEWNAYRNAVIAYQLKKFGPGRMVGAVEHLDEANQHIHVYLVPFDGESFGTVHPGIAARVRARALPGNHVRIAYAAAMVEWQDELWRETGRPHGLLRVGERRKRLTRIEFNAKTLVSNAEDKDRETARKRKKVEADVVALEARYTKLKAAGAHLKNLQERFAETPAGIVTRQLASYEQELATERAKSRSLQVRLEEAQFRNEQHERIARVTDSRGRESVMLNLPRQPPKP